MGTTTRAAPILVVEDDQALRGLTTRFLRFHGWEAVEAEHGRAALAYLQGGANVSVIVLDLRMPVMDGWAFRRAQQRDPRLRDIPLIVMAGADIERINELQADACFYKPAELPDVLACIERLTARSAPPG
jgi:CheY-like chemotaxis protein